MIPKIRFRYSWVFDEHYRASLKIQEALKKEGKEYPSQKKILNFIKKIKPEWMKVNEKVLKEISKISSLKWKEKEIICYVIGYGRAFSDPLTVRSAWGNSYFIDTLIHELIHQIQSQNSEINGKWRKYVKKTYKNEDRSTLNHIFLHALHKHIYLKMFSEKRLKADIKRVSLNPPYKKAWEIVEKEGYENIIKKYRQVINN